MPHDSKGQELHPGDTVILKATVLRTYKGETNDTCNVEMQVVGNASYQPLVNCSAGLATKVEE